LNAPRPLPQGSTFHVVMNAGSGADDKNDARMALQSGLTQRGNKVHFHLIDKHDDVEQVVARAKDACLKTQGVLVAAGGDGTVNAAASAVVGSDIPFAVVPLGTFNYFARDIGMPLEPAAAATAILGGTVSPIHVARLNKHLFLVNASIGLYVKLIEQREKHEARLGRSRIVSVISGLVTALRGHYAMSLDMAVDGKPVHLRTPLLFLGKNYLQLKNLDFDIAQGVADGQIGVILLRDANPLTILNMALRALFGKLEQAQKLHAFCAQRLQINTRRSKVSAVIDGEIVELQTPLNVEIARNALQVVRPRAGDSEPEKNSLAEAEG
jgi:diacylglycerol kinase family enzyme